MHPKPSNEPTLFRRPQVQQRTGLSRTTLYEYIKDGAFPAPVRLGARAVGWLESEVSEWIHARVKLTRQGGANAARRVRVQTIVSAAATVMWREPPFRVSRSVPCVTTHASTSDGLWRGPCIALAPAAHLVDRSQSHFTPSIRSSSSRP